MITKREARKLGTARGRNAAAWKFDGNTTQHTYETFVVGLEDGDPAVLDPYSVGGWLSGEHAGESMNELLDLQGDEDPGRVDAVAREYEEAAERAYWHELERAARIQVRNAKTLTYESRPGRVTEKEWRVSRGLQTTAWYYTKADAKRQLVRLEENERRAH